MFITNDIYPHPWTNGIGATGIAYPWQTITTTTSDPTECSENQHVFGCDHAAKCKCGQTTRKPNPPKCAHCGTTHK
jgi:hypothetical protein